MLYMAMLDMSVMDDMAISRAVKESGIMDLRLPLVTSYNAKQSESGLPPQAAHDMNPGGRPASEGAPGTEGQEASEDAGG